PHFGSPLVGVVGNQRCRRREITELAGHRPPSSGLSWRLWSAQRCEPNGCHSGDRAHPVPGSGRWRTTPFRELTSLVGGSCRRTARVLESLRDAWDASETGSWRPGTAAAGSGGRALLCTWLYRIGHRPCLDARG